MIKKMTVIGFTLLALTSCGTHAPSSTDAPLAETSAPQREAWWHEFHDPILDQLVTQLHAENLDLRAATARIREARGLRRITQADMFPQADITGNASQGNQRLGRSSHTIEVGFDAAWEIDLFGKTRAAIKGAKAREAQAVADRDALDNSLVAELARALTEWRQAREQQRVTTQLLASQDTQIELYATREKAGLINGSFAERARAQRTQTSVQLPLAEAAAERAQYQVEYLLGMKPKSLDLFFTDEKNAIFDPPAPQTLLDQKLERVYNRPDIRSARAALEAAQADVAQAEASLWPSLSLGSFFGVQNMSGIDAQSPVWAISASLTAPLLHFGKLKAAIDVADARKNQALLTYEATTLTALQEVQTALSDYLNGINAVAIQQASLAQRTTTLELARERFNRGLSDMIDLTTAQAEQDNATLSLVDRKAAASIAFIRLQKALAP